MNIYQEIIYKLERENEEFNSSIKKCEDYKKSNYNFNIKKCENKEANIKEELVELKYYLEMLKENRGNQILISNEYFKQFVYYFLIGNSTNLNLSLLTNDIDQFVKGEMLVLGVSFIASIGLAQFKLFIRKMQFKNYGIEPILDDIKKLENESMNNLMRENEFRQDNISYDEEIKELERQIQVNNAQIDLINDAMLEAEFYKITRIEEHLNKNGFEIDYDKRLLKKMEEV